LISNNILIRILVYRYRPTDRQTTDHATPSVATDRYRNSLAISSSPGLNRQYVRLLFLFVLIKLRQRELVVNLLYSSLVSTLVRVQHMYAWLRSRFSIFIVQSHLLRGR